LLAVAVLAANSWHRQRIAGRLLRAEPARILADPALLLVAVDLGRPLYQTHCAICHGSTLEGNRTRGVPNLAANAWLYGSDPIEVEHTILYGIRSGHPKSRNVADMPALVRSGQISEGDAHDVVEFLESLAGTDHDPSMAKRGRDVYYGSGNCFDCHASDAGGVTDYGTPPLLGPVWLYGGDRKTLYESIRNGRHGICPAWVGKLTPLQIRSLTMFLVSATHPANAVSRPSTGESSAD
jgi:cytochrome c oxidase cbb3-type subunit 3